ncbi:alpha/beta hydrolase [Henriciella aquimarina]|uniref:alpha/beta hydrolase n=1 Tax=Henriciella aquimarina TaxID=545261 RepID=UPI0009FF26D6|nr:alpha/beta hydrolase [Henriciella aquimarina]
MSLQVTIAKLLLKLPGNLLYKLGGGKPVEINGRVMDPQFQFIAHGAKNQPPMSSMPAADARAASAMGLEMFADEPVSGVEWRNQDIPSDGKHSIPVRIYQPNNQDPKAPVMVYYHFGGGVIGDLETCHVFCTILAKRVRCPIVSVDYRLAPEHKFPAGLNDCIDAYEWALRNAASLGAPAGVATMGGDSMGGNFTAIVTQEMMRERKPKPLLQLLIYPATELENEFPSYTAFGETYPLSADTMRWFMEQYLPEGQDRSDVRLSPARETRLEDLPPAIIVTAGFDPLVDDGAAYAELLRRSGVDVTYKCYDGLAHGFTAFTGVVKEARKACEEIAGMVADAYADFEIEDDD